MKYSSKHNWNNFAHVWAQFYNMQLMKVFLEHCNWFTQLNESFLIPIRWTQSELTELVSLTIFSTCCEKLWLTKVASSAKFLGEFKFAPSSCGGSVAVSLTVSRSKTYKTNTSYLTSSHSSSSFFLFSVLPLGRSKKQMMPFFYILGIFPNLLVCFFISIIQAIFIFLGS